MRSQQVLTRHRLSRLGALAAAGCVLAAAAPTSSSAELGTHSPALASAANVGGAVDRLATLATAPTTVATAKNRKLGRILASAHGYTLYMFTRDSHGVSTCSGTCARRWVPLLAGRVAARSGSGLNPRLLGTSTRSNGDRQATYNHHPLYRFSGDTSAGKIAGEGADQFGGHWYAVNVTGKEVKPMTTNPCDPVCSGY